MLFLLFTLRYVLYFPFLGVHRYYSRLKYRLFLFFFVFKQRLYELACSERVLDPLIGMELNLILGYLTDQKILFKVKFLSYVFQSLEIIS